MRLGRVVRRWKAFGRDRAGNIALTFALGFPVLVVIVVAAVELQALSADKSRMQAVADAAALNAATQMRFAANDQLLTRTRSALKTELVDLRSRPDEPDVRFMFTQSSPSGVRVALTARRMSFFGNLVPPGGFVISVESSAEQLGTVPLCVLASAATGGNTLDLPSGSIIARSCLVHSNRDIGLGPSSLLDAAAVQAGGAIKGGAPANAGEGAAVIPDPLTSMFNGTGPGPCNFRSQVQVDEDDEQSPLLQPGVHCRKFDIEDGTLRFAPGVHHLFNNELQLKKNAKIVGENVTLVIWRDLKITWDGRGDLLDLTGSQGGTGEAAKWAGFVLAVDPTRTGDIRLNFEEIRKLEGVVYAPSIKLIVPGGINPTEVTPWTVIVARELRVEGGRSLQINADYSSSSVPVPNGVGNKATAGAPVRLVR